MLCNFRGRVLPYRVGVIMLTLNTRLDTRRDSRVRLGSGNDAKTVQLRIVTDGPTDRPTRQREVSRVHLRQTEAECHQRVYVTVVSRVYNSIG